MSEEFKDRQALHLTRLSFSEKSQALLRQIEGDYLVSEETKKILELKINEYLRLKEYGLPSAAEAKWNEITALLNSLESKK